MSYGSLSLYFIFTVIQLAFLIYSCSCCYYMLLDGCIILYDFCGFKGGQTIFPSSDGINFAVVQTKLKAPDPIRTPQLSSFRHG